MGFVIEFDQNGIATWQSGQTAIGGLNNALEAILSSDGVLKGAAKGYVGDVGVGYLKFEALNSRMIQHNNIAKQLFEDPYNVNLRDSFNFSKQRLTDAVSYFNSWSVDPLESYLQPLKDQAYSAGLKSLDGYTSDVNLSSAERLRLFNDVSKYLQLHALDLSPENVDFALENLKTREAARIRDYYDVECFPAHTRIQTSLTTSIAISALRTGDIVLAYDSRADIGRGALVPRRVTRLYRNTTTEWIRLRWFDGEARELITTPGHHFLDQFGQFPTIAEMTRDGRTTVVLASGALAEVTAERIFYSAETAHLFERATVQGMVMGNAALKSVEADAWQTYNFEVEDLHTSAMGGVRIHNKLGLNDLRFSERTSWQ